MKKSPTLKQNQSLLMLLIYEVLNYSCRGKKENKVNNNIKELHNIYF